jgi:hypothetical protein
MEKNAASNIDYLLAIEAVHKDYLAAIRHWGNAKVATDGEMIWVNHLDYAQVNSVEVKSMPYKLLFYERNGKLYPIGSRLPDRATPALLWTPIERAIPVGLPSFNHNFFGISESITLKIVPTDAVREVEAMITDLAMLQQYMVSAPEIRLQSISWAILNNDTAFLTGTPLLPIDGDVYWTRSNMLLPAGYDLNYYALTETISRQLCPENDSWIVWSKESTYFLIEKEDLQILSRSSLRASLEHIAS